MSDLKTEMARLIHDERNRLKLTIADLAAEAGISEAYLKKIEAGKVESPSFKIVVRLARRLAIDINDLAALVSSGFEEYEEETARAVFEAFPKMRTAYFDASNSMDAKTRRRVLEALAEIAERSSTDNADT